MVIVEVDEGDSAHVDRSGRARVPAGAVASRTTATPTAGHVPVTGTRRPPR